MLLETPHRSDLCCGVHINTGLNDLDPFWRLQESYKNRTSVKVHTFMLALDYCRLLKKNVGRVRKAPAWVWASWAFAFIFQTKQVHPPPVPPPLPPIHMSVSVITNTQGIQLPAPPVSTFMECPTHGKEAASSTSALSASSGPAQQQQQQQQQQQAAQKAVPFSQTHSLLQPPPDQVMVIERMHSGQKLFTFRFF